MTDQRPKEKWIEVIGEINACSSCVMNNNCIQIKTHIKHCIAAKYRFRCPIEVLDERQEGSNKMNLYYTTEEVMDLVDDLEPLREYLNGFPNAYGSGLYCKKYVDMYINR